MGSNIVADGLRKVLMAGVGAVAAVGEKGGQVVDALAERGESVVRQGRELGQELAQKSGGASADAREEMLRTRLAAMSPERRAAFVATVCRIAAELDGEQAQAQQAASAPADSPEAAGPVNG